MGGRTQGHVGEVFDKPFRQIGSFFKIGAVCGGQVEKTRSWIKYFVPGALVALLVVWIVIHKQEDHRLDNGTTEKLSQVPLKVASPAFVNGGMYSVEFTGDGRGVSPPVEWSGAPEGTKYYALSLWHVPGPGDVKSYWLVYDIPGEVKGLVQNSSGVGKVGFNDKGMQGYDPMKSKGPGVKEYQITVYALSAKPDFGSGKVTRVELRRAIQDITLAEGTLSYQHERKRSGK